MKKLLLTLGLCAAVTSPALAQQETRGSGVYSPLTGLYAGVQGGYTWNDVDTDVAGLDFDIDGGEYGVFLGYQIDHILDATVGRMGLGLNGAIEVYYTESNADDSIGVANLEKEHDWGITFKPGLSILDPYSPFGAKPYGIIGYRNATFKGSVPGGSADEDFDGFELGLGAELLAYEKIGVRLDYSHVFYEENGGFDPDEDSLRLGVAYHF